MNGAKYFMNLAGVPVGDARLPSLPLPADAAAKLRSARDAFCLAGGAPSVPLKICAGAPKAVELEAAAATAP